MAAEVGCEILTRDVARWTLASRIGVVLLPAQTLAGKTGARCIDGGCFRSFWL
jgi:hypothetical protein